MKVIVAIILISFTMLFSPIVFSKDLIKASDSSNGSQAPIRLIFSPPLKQGDKIDLYINESIALRLSIKKGFFLEAL